MKRTILRIDGSNMAGFVWCYSFRLSSARGSLLTLTLSQSARGEDRLDVAPMTGLRTGVELYEALSDMLIKVGFSMMDQDVDAIAEEIEQVDSDIAIQFRNAPAELEAAAEAERQLKEAREHEALAPFVTRIEAYVSRFSDDKQYFPGAGHVYPSPRNWVRLFLKQYVLAHGKLPTGKHLISVKGYSGGEHDFSDLAAS
jgi:hypothetical protein